MQHPFTNRQDEIALLGQRNKLGRRDQSQPLRTPAQQGLNTDDLHGGVDDSLVVQPELGVADSTAQLSRQLGAAVDSACNWG